MNPFLGRNGMKSAGGKAVNFTPGAQPWPRSFPVPHTVGVMIIMTTHFSVEFCHRNPDVKETKPPG